MLNEAQKNIQVEIDVEFTLYLSRTFAISVLRTRRDKVAKQIVVWYIVSLFVRTFIFASCSNLAIPYTYNPVLFLNNASKLKKHIRIIYPQYI